MSTIEIAEALVSAGGRAMVATEGGRMAARITEVGGELVQLEASTKNPAKIWANVTKLQKVFAEQNVSLVHARSRAPAWSARIAARRAGIPFVTTYHGAYAERGRIKRFYNSVMASADRVIANSGYTARLIQKRYGTESEHIRIIHRGVDMRNFDPAAIPPLRVQRLREAWGIAPDQRVVLHAARLTSWKGQSVVLEAAGLLAANGALDRLVFVFAGDEQGRTEYLNQLKTQAASLGISDFVRFPGHVSHIAAAFAAAHVAVVASTEPEAFGRAATEAQAMGCPVIATNIGAPPETVVPASGDDVGNATGWLVPPNDPDALAVALGRGLALSEQERTALGARARAHVAASFTLDAMKQATLAVYDELLGTSLAARLPGSGTWETTSRE